MCAARTAAGFLTATGSRTRGRTETAAVSATAAAARSSRASPPDLEKPAGFSRRPVAINRLPWYNLKLIVNPIMEITMKRIIRFGVVALGMTLLSLQSENLILKNGTVYKNYSVDRPTPYGLVIFHDAGGATIPYAELPDELRKKYSEDEKRAATDIKRIEDDKKAEAEKVAERKFKAELEKKREKLYNYTFIQSLPPGILAFGDGRMIYITGYPQGKLASGDIVFNETDTVKRMIVDNTRSDKLNRIGGNSGGVRR